MFNNNNPTNILLVEDSNEPEVKTAVSERIRKNKRPGKLVVTKESGGNVWKGGPERKRHAN